MHEMDIEHITNINLSVFFAKCWFFRFDTEFLCFPSLRHPDLDERFFNCQLTCEIPVSKVCGSRQDFDVDNVHRNPDLDDWIIN